MLDLFAKFGTMSTQRRQHALDPAFSVIARLGGDEKVAEILDRHPASVRKWTYPEDSGGTGGLIPTACATKLLEYARKKKIPLEADDFFLLPRPSRRRAGPASVASA